jgi:hypothetical protein
MTDLDRNELIKRKGYKFETDKEESFYMLGIRDAEQCRPEDIVKISEIVWEFLYNSSCCESSSATMSIHRSQKGAEMAMEFHKAEIKKNYDRVNEDDEEYKQDFPFDYDQWWGIRATSLQD